MKYVSGVANPVVVDSTHECMKSHELRECSLLSKLLVIGSMWGELKSIKLKLNNIMKYALVKKIKLQTQNKLYRDFQIVIMQMMARWPLLIECLDLTHFQKGP